MERAAYEAELEPVCVDNGLGVINYYALASGFLTGKYRSSADLGKSVRSGGAKKYLDDRGRAVLGALDAVADTVGATPGQVALAWQIARPSVTAPIASASTPAQLDELVGAARLRLDTPSIELIDRASRVEAGMTAPPPGKGLSMTQVLICGAAIVTLSMGIRHGFGLWLQPVTMDRGWSRETFAFALAVQNLAWGIAGPLTGALADRCGAFRVLIAGACSMRSAWWSWAWRPRGLGVSRRHRAAPRRSPSRARPTPSSTA